jgi:hypothetical protein
MPGAGVQIVRDRVGGSVVSGAAHREHLVLMVQLLSVRCPSGCRRSSAVPPGGVGVREDGAPAPPAARPRAEGALEPVGKVLTEGQRITAMDGNTTRTGSGGQTWDGGQQ